MTIKSLGSSGVSKRVISILVYAVLLGWMLVNIMPFLWTITTSLRK